jgi:hypothetical protein
MPLALSTGHSIRAGSSMPTKSSVQGRTESEGPPVAAGLFQVLALKCLSVYHLTIWPFNFMNSALLVEH